MDKYTKGAVTEVTTSLPFDTQYTTGVPVMSIKPGTKSQNIRTFAQHHLEKPESRHIIFFGKGQACMKAISCVEVFKRDFKACPLYQLNQIRFVRVVEQWDPLEKDLEKLQVNRDIPAIYILLTKDQLDESLPGYQSPYGLSQSSSGSLPPRQEHTEAKQGGKRPKSSRPNRWKRPDKTGRSAGHSANQAASDQSNKQVTDSPSTSLIE